MHCLPCEIINLKHTTKQNFLHRTRTYWLQKLELKKVQYVLLFIAMICDSWLSFAFQFDESRFVAIFLAFLVVAHEKMYFVKLNVHRFRWKLRDNTVYILYVKTEQIVTWSTKKERKNSHPKANLQLAYNAEHAIHSVQLFIPWKRTTNHIYFFFAIMPRCK